MEADGDGGAYGSRPQPPLEGPSRNNGIGLASAVTPWFGRIGDRSDHRPLAATNRPFATTNLEGKSSGNRSSAETGVNGEVAPTTAIRPASIELVKPLRLLGCLPLKNGAACSGGRRPRSLGEETGGRGGTSVPRD